jgi:hypothetical protein
MKIKVNKKQAINEITEQEYEFVEEESWETLALSMMNILLPR